MKSKKKRLLIILAVVLAVFAGTLISNKFRTDFTQLSATDQAILTEYGTYCSKESSSPIWKGFSLSDKPVAVLSKNSLSVYLINPSQDINSIFAEKIKMPDTFSAGSVYRLSILLPEIWKMKLTGNFNTLEEKYPLFGNDVYYVKYNKAISLDKKYSSEHFITFLSHEAFHYYMQNQWKSEEPADAASLTDNDLKLMSKEYDILAKIQQYLLRGKNSPDELKDYARQYAAAMDARMTANPTYTTSEVSKETAEGSATYVSIKASKMVGYDYGVMYFDNVKDVSFGDVFPQLEAGNLEKEYLYTRMPYETGALLCEMMDALNVPDWQETLNKQTLDAPQTLYSVLKQYVTSGGKA